MPNVEVEIGSRRYQVACRAGEEQHLQDVAAIVDRKAHEAAGALGNLGETRQLLYASLLLGDEILEQRSGRASAPETAPADDEVVDALERLAAKIESLAERLEAGAHNP